MSFNQVDPSALGQSPQQLDQKPRGWWLRNWKWFVPTLLLVIIIFCCGIPGYFIWYFVSKIKGLEPYGVAVGKVLTDPQLKEAIGEPIQPVSIIPTVVASGESGEAKYLWDVTGPKGTAKIEMLARKIGENWELVVLTATLPDGKKISLLDETGGNVAPPFDPQAGVDTEESPKERPPPDLNPKIPPAK